MTSSSTGEHSEPSPFCFLYKYSAGTVQVQCRYSTSTVQYVLPRIGPGLRAPAVRRLPRQRHSLPPSTLSHQYPCTQSSTPLSLPLLPLTLPPLLPLTLPPLAACLILPGASPCIPLLPLSPCVALLPFTLYFPATCIPLLPASSSLWPAACSSAARRGQVDPVSAALAPLLGSMLGAVYHNAAAGPPSQQANRGAAPQDPRLLGARGRVPRDDTVAQLQQEMPAGGCRPPLPIALLFLQAGDAGRRCVCPWVLSPSFLV